MFEYIDRGSKLKSVKYPKLDITFMTAHASKGLGYDNVIVVNGRNETYGFPSKIEDDPVLSFVIKGDRSIDYAEERRLFYVAMTRTKNRVYFLAPEENPSEFLLEIKRDYKNVVLRGTWNENPPKNSTPKKSCPICGYPMQFRYKNAYGLRLHICTNEPEVCGFMTNEYRAGKLSIMKCDQCRDGYLIVKPAKDGDFFLGCSNYKKDGTGCGRSLSKKQYYDMLNLGPDPIPQPDSMRDNQRKREAKQTTVKSDPQSTRREVIEKANTRVFTYEESNLNDTVFTILQCLSNVSAKRYYGISVLTDILRGANSQKIKSAELDRIPEYGTLKHIRREILVNIIDWLIEQKFILKTKGTYPVLHPTYDGMHYAETMTNAKLKKLQVYLMEQSS